MNCLILIVYSALLGISYECNTLRIRDWNLNDLPKTYVIRPGSFVTLICDGTCQGPGYTPSLRWTQPGGRLVQPFPGRLMSVFQESRRQIKLYLQEFRQSDQGTYTCEGWINGRWRTVSILLTSDHILPRTGGIEEMDVIGAPSLPPTLNDTIVH